MDIRPGWEMGFPLGASPTGFVYAETPLASARPAVKRLNSEKSDIVIVVVAVCAVGWVSSVLS